MVFTERVGEPAGQGGLHQRCQALSTRKRCSLAPHRDGIGCALARAVCNDHVVQDVWMANGKHLSNHAAQRQANPMRACDAQMSE